MSAEYQVASDGEEIWNPLESDSSVMNDYLSKLGIIEGLFEFHEVYDFDCWKNNFIQSPVVSFLFCYPFSDEDNQYWNSIQDKIENEGQVVSPNLHYITQHVHNECGTIAVFHALLNSITPIHKELIDPDSILGRLLALEQFDHEHISSFLRNDSELKKIHNESASEGATGIDLDEVFHHFIALVHVDGCAYLMDGMKRMPINLGECDNKQFIQKSFEFVKNFCSRFPDVYDISLMALTTESL